MRLIYLSIAAATVAGTANAAIPFFNATCTAHLEVHADEGGYVYLNGKEARITEFNENYYEAKVDNTVVSITINPDGTVMASYTHNDANGVCTITS